MNKWGKIYVFCIKTSTQNICILQHIAVQYLCFMHVYMLFKKKRGVCVCVHVCMCKLSNQISRGKDELQRFLHITFIWILQLILTKWPNCSNYFAVRINIKMCCLVVKLIALFFLIPPRNISIYHFHLFSVRDCLVVLTCFLPLPPLDKASNPKTLPSFCSEPPVILCKLLFFFVLVLTVLHHSL